MAPRARPLLRERRFERAALAQIEAHRRQQSPLGLARRLARLPLEVHIARLDPAQIRELIESSVVGRHARRGCGFRLGFRYGFFIDPTTPLRALAQETAAVVCCFNGERYLSELLRSIQTQTIAPGEILVVDNASTDGSREVARRGFPGVRLIELATNEGPCVARNRGMRETSKRLVLALDVDVILEPDCLERLLAAFAADPGLAVAAPRAIAEGAAASVQYDGARFHYTGLLSLRNFYKPLAEAEGTGVVSVDAFISVAILADREKLLSVGGYDPAFFFYFEDSDLSYRLHSGGHRLACVEEARVTHRGGTSDLRSAAAPAPRAAFITIRAIAAYSW